MKKKDEISLPASTLNKANDDEMLFILRARDYSSPQTILYWISENLETCSDEKLREAFECALVAKKQIGRRPAD